MFCIENLFQAILTLSLGFYHELKPTKIETNTFFFLIKICCRAYINNKTDRHKGHTYAETGTSKLLVFYPLNKYIYSLHGILHTRKRCTNVNASLVNFARI